MNKAARNLTQVFALSAAAALMGCGGGATTKTDATAINPAEPVTDWQMVWNDEFDGETIDSSKWTHEINCAGGGNNEKQCYTNAPENSYIDNGVLHIVGWRNN